jgi:Protein of unknown function (DUF3467)
MKVSNSNTKSNVSPQVIRGPEFKDIYSNVSRVGATPFDLSVTFGKIVEIPGATNAIEDLIIVRFSPQQFKSLTDGLVRILAAWERAFGEIKKTTPDHNDKILDEFMQKMRAQVSPKS